MKTSTGRGQGQILVGDNSRSLPTLSFLPVDFKHVVGKRTSENKLIQGKLGLRSGRLLNYQSLRIDGRSEFAEQSSRNNESTTGDNGELREHFRLMMKLVMVKGSKV